MSDSKPARILIIAGSDSGGGAGIQVDIKTVTMLGGYAMTAVTAITAQNTLGVQAVHPIPTDMVIAQVNSVMSDIGVDAVKIGMIGSAETANAVADYLSRVTVPIVFDPVMVATSGAVLADDATIAAFGRLMSIALVITPNLPELEALGGIDAILEHGCRLLVKGGHSETAGIADILYAANADPLRWEGDRIDTTSTHGTGCTLATAIATRLGQGHELQSAIARARQFVRLSLHDAPGFGGGYGPMGQQKVRLDIGGDMRLNQITLTSIDYASSVSFYLKLGLEQIVDSPDNGYARFEAEGGVTLSIHSGERAPNVATATIYFECTDLDAVVAQLKSQDITFTQDPVEENWKWREARLCDPSGNSLCLYQADEMRRYPPWRI